MNRNWLKTTVMLYTLGLAIACLSIVIAAVWKLSPVIIGGFSFVAVAYAAAIAKPLTRKSIALNATVYLVWVLSYTVYDLAFPAENALAFSVMCMVCLFIWIARKRMFRDSAVA